MVRVRDLMTAAAAAAFFVSAGAQGAQQVHIVGGGRGGVRRTFEASRPWPFRRMVPNVVYIASGEGSLVCRHGRRCGHRGRQANHGCARPTRKSCDGATLWRNDRLVCRITWTSRQLLILNLINFSRLVVDEPRRRGPEAVGATILILRPVSAALTTEVCSTGTQQSRGRF